MMQNETTSSFLKMKILQGGSHRSKYTSYGKVRQVLGLAIEASLKDIPVGAVCEIIMEDGSEPRLAEVIGLKDSGAQLMMIGDTTGVKIGSLVRPLENRASIGVGESLLGRVINPLGVPVDGLETPSRLHPQPLYAIPVPAMERRRVLHALTLGIRSVDGLMTVGEGQRICIMSGSGVGKSTLMGMMARNTSAEVNVIALLGERGREVKDFIEKDLGAEGLRRSIVVVSTSDDPPLLRMRCAFAATAIAEYFRERGKKVLLMMDSLTRFAMATREVGLSVGEPPTTRGYTPTTFSLLPKILERAGTTGHDGSITGIYTVLSEGDDINDPIADAVRSIVDGHIVLSRKLANEGHFPAIDILHSLSRVMPDVVEENHILAARKIRSLLASYMEMEDYINIGAYTAGKNADLDEAVRKIQQIKQFLRQQVSEKNSLPETFEWMRGLAG